VGSRVYQLVPEPRNIGFYSRKLTPAEKSLPLFSRSHRGGRGSQERRDLRAFVDRTASGRDRQPRPDIHGLRGERAAERVCAQCDCTHPRRIRHIPGKTNTVADVLSRHQMVGKDELSVTGYGTALTKLLQRLREDIKSARNVWVYAHSSDLTVQYLRQVQQWRAPTHALSTGAPVDAKLARKFNFVILAPTPKAPTVAHKLLHRRRPFAVLMSADLFRHLAKRDDGTVDMAVSEVLKKSGTSCLATLARCVVQIGDLNGDDGRGQQRQGIVLLVFQQTAGPGLLRSVRTPCRAKTAGAGARKHQHRIYRRLNNVLVLVGRLAGGRRRGRS
jgi:hypothetical protein